MIEGLNKETLKRLYVREGKSTSTIAKMYGCSPTTIRKRCREYGISLRSPTKAREIKGLNKEKLERLYITEQKTIREIAKMFGCSCFGILYRCKKYGIKLRPKWKKLIKLDKSVLKRLYVREGKSSKEIAEMFSCSPYTVRKRFREYGISLRGRRIKGLTKPLLHKLYIKEGKTTREIGKIVGCSFDVVRKRCKQFGIPLRNPGCKKIEIDESALRRLYIKNRKSMTEIAKMFDCGINIISKRVKRFGLQKELR